jgi:hypothetical protein
MNSHLYWTVAYPAVAGNSQFPALNTYVVPKYTDAACAAHWTGVISVMFSINDEGALEDVGLKDDAFDMGDGIREALQKWRFAPAVLNGKPVRSSAIIEFGFGSKGKLLPPTVEFKTAPQPPPLGPSRSSTGPLVLSVVVDVHGSPVNIRVAHSLGSAWDDQGIAAVQKWRFRPGFLDSLPIATEATVAVTFP